MGSTARGTQDLAPALPDFDIWIPFNGASVASFLHEADEVLPNFAQFVDGSGEFKEFCELFLCGVKGIVLESEAFRPFPKSIANPENYIGKIYVSKQSGERKLLIDIGMVPPGFTIAVNVTAPIAYFQ